MNGTKENTDSFGLMITGELRDVLKVLRSDGFQEALTIDEEKEIGQHSFVFRTPTGRQKQLFIAVVSDPNDSGKTQLATVSYIQNYYGIVKAGDLLNESRRNTIELALKRAGLEFSLDDTDSLARLLAYENGLYVTESKLLTLRSVPPHTKALIIGLVLMFVIMTALWQFKYISIELVESFYIFAGLAILTDLLPLLKSKRKKHA